MNQNLEELKELLMYSYRKLGYTVTTDKDMLYLRFSPDSQSPAVMVRCANESRPLDRAAVQQMFMEFERMGAQNGCHQYRLVNLSGFEDGCKVFEDYNMALSDASYLRRMNKPGFLDLYAHNEKMYREICSSFETVNKVAAVQATGSGKSLLIAASVRDNAGQQQLVIAPRTNIHAEIARHIPEGVKVDYMTFQMLGLMQAENRLDSLKYDRIYIDEFHHGGATRWGAAIEELLAGNPTAKVLGTVMLVLIGYVAFSTNPPVAEAATHAIVPTNYPWLATITLIGGTVGGYITFSGGHRLIDAGITGREHLKDVRRAAFMGMSVDAIVRILLFLAVLGVVSMGFALDPKDPAGSAFLLGAGEIGHKLFGIVFFCAALTSVVGAAYTSVSFLKTLFKVVERYEKLTIMAFIFVSTCILIFIGKPATLLIVAGSVNGLILPVTLAVMLLATRKTNIVGDYKHNPILFYTGWIVVLVTAYIGVTSLQGIAKLLG